MFRRSPAKAIVSVAVIVLGTIVFSSATWAEGFDKPVRQTILDLGPSPNQLDFPNLHVHLSCYYYPSFMLKQLEDDGNKGALRVSVLRVQESQAPTCARPLGVTEKELPLRCEYYEGVKSEFIFLIDCDGDGEGRYFEVFQASNLTSLLWDSLRFNTLPRFGRTADGRLTMRYEQIFFADCSLMEHSGECWKKIKSKIGLSTAVMPKCRGYVDPKILEDHSLIGYPVEVVLLPKPVTKTLPGPVHCFAAQ
jgi:hypothetical protein